MAGSQTQPPYRLHGLKLSYFTGKLEAYLQVKGVPFTFVEMDTADFRACAQATGVAQMPQLEAPDGTWLTDTTDIIGHFEDRVADPALRPADPVTGFASLLLEDLFDEWFWRPALYYRWAFKDDAALMSARIAKTMLRDMPLPFALRRRFILARQRRVFLSQDGITKKTAPQVEALFLEALDGLEACLADRPFLFGTRPVEADFGLFGSMFRHFSIDPTPAGIMRERAPRVLHWVARVWATRAPDLAGTTQPGAIPGDLAPLFHMTAADYLPYLAANARAVAAGARDVRYETRDVSWRVPAAPYRARCLAVLQTRFQALDAAGRAQILTLLGPGGAVLAEPPAADLAAPARRGRPRDRLWRRTGR
ncbi:MAG: glutathione S-transferase family protein [Alphaproteobacteria bacterium]